MTLVFVDGIGGGLAALGAGVAHALGISGAVASTSVRPLPVPTEVTDALKEVGMKVPSVTTLDEAAGPEARFIFLGGAPPEPPIEGAAHWEASLYVSPQRDAANSFELQRMATTRIVRDQIERRLEALRPHRESTRPAST